jgi:hypothetical protein
LRPLSGKLTTIEVELHNPDQQLLHVELARMVRVRRERGTPADRG